jgi:hypothetical protein
VQGLQELMHCTAVLSDLSLIVTVCIRVARWYFSGKKSQFWIIFVSLGMENLGIFYGHFGTFKSIWCILPPFGIFCGNLVYIYSPFGMLQQVKSGNPSVYLRKWMTKTHL